jgi:hypothetical protein
MTQLDVFPRSSTTDKSEMVEIAEIRKGGVIVPAGNSWLDPIIAEIKKLMIECAKDTFRRYRKSGQLIINSGYEKGQWNSEHKRYFLEKLNIKRTTFQYMVELGDMDEDEFTNAIGKFPSLFGWANQKALTTTEFTPQLYNVWNFAACDDRFGDQSFEGRIPGQIVQNILYYFTVEGDLVVDPMAGGGTTYDVCRSMNRKVLCYDLNPVRADIKQNDIIEGFPEEASGADLIFLDTPYWNMVFDLHSTVEKFYEFVRILAEKSFETVKQNGVVAYLIEDMTEKANECLSGESYRIFRDQGFTCIAHISCPLSTEQFLPQQVIKAKENKHLLGRNRDLYIFKKVLEHS